MNGFFCVSLYSGYVDCSGYYTKCVAMLSVMAALLCTANAEIWGI